MKLSQSFLAPQTCLSPSLLGRFIKMVWGGEQLSRVWLSLLYIMSLVTHFAFARALWAPTGVCLVCGFSLITSSTLGLEAFHMALPFEWKLF